MSRQTDNYLKVRFQTGNKPTQQDFHDLIDSKASTKDGLFCENQSEPDTPIDGGIIYVENGSLKYKGSSGTVTVLANA